MKFKTVYLKNFSTIHIGGQCRYFFECKNLTHLKNVFKFINSKNLPYFVLGKGSNTIFSDEGFEGVIIKLSGDFKKDELVNSFIKMGGGINNGAVLSILEKYKCKGLEFLSTFPGTIGGDIIGNAGIKNYAVGNFVEYLEVFIPESGEVRILEKKDLNFSYRNSNLKDIIILYAYFNLPKIKSENEIRQTYEEILKKRLKTQPQNCYTAGCIFKNLPDVSAGELIDKAGLKNYSVGELYVSPIHANFIVNKGNGTQKNFISLIKNIKSKIKEKFKVELSLEVNVINKKGEKCVI